LPKGGHFGAGLDLPLNEKLYGGVIAETRCLPREPSLDKLDELVDFLLPLARDGERGALEFLSDFHPSPPVSPTRDDVELAVAQSYGFESWPKLRGYVETANRLTRNPHQQPIGGPIATDEERIDEFLRLACLNYGRDDPERIERARAMLGQHPELATATIHTIAAVGDVAAARERLVEQPALARQEGGPFRWEPLLYVAYSADPTIRDPEHDSPPQGWAEYNREDEAARYLASISSGE